MDLRGKKRLFDDRKISAVMGESVVMGEKVNL